MLAGENTRNLCVGKLTKTKKADGESEYRCLRCGALICITDEGAYNVYTPNSLPAPASEMRNEIALPVKI